MRKVRCPSGCDKGRFYQWDKEYSCVACEGTTIDKTSNCLTKYCGVCKGSGVVMKTPPPLKCKTCSGAGFVYNTV